MQVQSSSLQMSMQYAASASLRIDTRTASSAAASLPVDSADRVTWSDRVGGARDGHRAHGHRGHGHDDESNGRRVGHERRHHGGCDRPAGCEQASADDDGAGIADPGIRMLRQVIEWLTGDSVEVFDARALDGDPPASAAQVPAQLPGEPAAGSVPPPAAGAGGAAWAVQAAYRETESLQVKAQGTVQTADGQTLSFSIELQMQRSYSATLSASGGEVPAPRDPLVVNFGGQAAQLSDQRFAFDLNQDGAPDAMRLPASGSGLLVFDRNGNGQLDDASELFGPASGDGFADLARLDEDDSGWVDSADAAYAKLGVMANADGSTRAIRSLGSLGIGALGTSRIDTPFSLKDAQNRLLGQIRSTGVYLNENGSAGTLQQLDVVV